MKTFFSIPLMVFFLYSCKGKDSLQRNEKKIGVKNQVNDTIHYTYRDTNLIFDIECTDSIPYSHLIILNAGQGINEKIDFSGNEKSFFEHYQKKMKMFSYFSFDTLKCEYKIYNDTLEFIFMEGYDLFSKGDRFFLIRR